MLAVGLLVPFLLVSLHLQDCQAAVFGDTRGLQLNSVSAIAKLLVANPSRIKRATGASVAASGSPASSPPAPPPLATASRFKKLMQLLEAGKLEDCAGRVVCDLNCDSDRYGASGKRVLALMDRVTEAGVMDAHDIQLLGAAGVSGRMYYWTTGCQRCRDVYPSCFTDSAELIEVASLFDVDSL